MRLLNLISPFFIFIIFQQGLLAQEVDCAPILNFAKKGKEEIEANIKAKKDINHQLENLENTIKNFPQCVSYEKLKLNSQKMASYYKYRFAPDRSFNLPPELCNEIKIDTKDMPKNRNQGPLSWCFAFSAADLISFQEKKQFSAYDIAIQFHVKDGESKFEKIADNGGWSDLAAYLAQESTKGICLEKNVNYKDADWLRMSEMMLKMGTSPKPLSTIICENEFGEKEFYDSLSRDVIKALDKLSTPKRTSALMDIHCQERVKLKKDYDVYSSNIYGGGKPEAVVEDMDAILDRGLPVSIGYHSALLYDGENKVGQADHASTVIGRKFNPESGNCEYLIKNSWGTKEDCQETASIRCENGNYWVSRTSLKNNIDSAAWVQEIKELPTVLPPGQ